MALKTGKKRQEPQVMMEINTTPLIDVMLVLLIMLIITIPVQLHTVELDLPVPVDSPPPPPPGEPETVRIRIESGDRILLDDVQVSLSQLDARLAVVARLPEQPELHIRPDKQAGYGAVVAVMATVQRHGLNRIGLEGSEQFEP